jgi:hypothetical protein
MMKNKASDSSNHPPKRQEAKIQPETYTINRALTAAAGTNAPGISFNMMPWS